jgi:hypothetical protein
MAHFIITCEHEASECAAMEEELQHLGPAEVIRGKDFHCSCPYGHHGGWVAVEGDSAEGILASLPPIFRSHASAYQIETMVF